MVTPLDVEAHRDTPPALEWRSGDAGRKARVEGITHIPRQTAATVEHFIVQVDSLETEEGNDT